MAVLAARMAGRFAREALAQGAGEVCALARGGFYLRLPGERYALVGGEALGGGPLHAVVADFRPAGLGERIEVDLRAAAAWTPPPAAPGGIDFRLAAQAAPAQGLACLIGGSHNALSVHAQPALEALERWLVGHSLGAEAEGLIGLGSGARAAGDDYLGGVLVALRLDGRGAQADSLWRWLAPRLAGRTPGTSAAHLAAAAAGEAQEALHVVLGGEPAFARLDASGWNGLAGAAAVLKPY